MELSRFVLTQDTLRFPSPLSDGFPIWTVPYQVWKNRLLANLQKDNIRTNKTASSFSWSSILMSNNRTETLCQRQFLFLGKHGWSCVTTNRHSQPFVESRVSHVGNFLSARASAFHMNSRRYGTQQQLSFERKTLSEQKIRELVLQKWWLLVLNMTGAGKKLRKVIASMIRRRPSMTLLPHTIIFLYGRKPSEWLESKVFLYCTGFALKKCVVMERFKVTRFCSNLNLNCFRRV